MNLKKYIILIPILLLEWSSLLAQTSEVAINPEHANKVLSDLVLGSGLAVIMGAIIALAYINNTLMARYKMQLLEKHGADVMEKVGLIKKESWWKRQYKKWTNVVPIEKEADVMLHHDYDGIKELDNSLPPWWLAMFYITIAFGVGYIYLNHFSDYGKSSSEAYAMEMEVAAANVKAYRASQANTIDETNVTLLEDESAIALGETVFKINCAACHGQLGEGGVGPNLTDDYWIHGGDIKDVFKTIKYGVPEKGMIAWQAQLPPADIHRISSYILTLRGTNPPNAKEAQGELYEAVIAEEADTVE